MRILLAAKHAPGGSRPIGGVQSWCRAIGAALRQVGHEVQFWEPEFLLPEGNFDLGIISHFSDCKEALALCRRAIFVSHGVVKAEAPPARGLVLYTSEEVSKHWNQPGPTLRQPIDLGFWTPGEHQRELFILYSYRAENTFGLRIAAESLHLPFFWLKDVDAEAARAKLQRAAVVFASGRAALEAMACGVPTVICDHRPYQGPALYCADIEVARRHNYSGRGGVLARTVSLADVAARAMREQFDPRGYVATWHDAGQIASELMTHAEAAC